LIDLGLYVIHVRTVHSFLVKKSAQENPLDNTKHLYKFQRLRGCLINTDSTDEKVYLITLF